MVRQTLQEETKAAVLCWLATISAKGTPIVSPKEVFCLHASNLLTIADIASPVSVRNVRGNPNVCVSYVDIFRQRGFKFVGKARIISPEERDFDTYGDALVNMASGAFTIRNVILVSIERVSRIRAPSYTFYPDRSEEMLMSSAYEQYGVKPIH
ncbi:flavin-nucleotide-binding protein [Metarhizobium album]|uniref:Flavin-nucleotide-binding protein n=1 Tax=Metarhizobium album TaxID=2182425 RepID=A0A2U2DGU1_9HYPH|nr:pyridoxamine 5'-phosphate oxidase family protein [Rhizobium album]PWE52537.1 flavin-nucleotide-binding protein [Rhizobium album]